MRGLLLFVLGTLLWAQSGLERKLQAAAPAGRAWAYYTVAMRPGQTSLCGSGTDRLTMRQTKLMLEGPRRLRLLFRLEGGKVQQLSLASEDCEIVPGGERLLAVPDVTEEDSIAFLAGRGDDTAMLALSLHAHPAATARLIELTKDKSDARRQGKAFFWLARSTDPAAIRFIDEIFR